MKIKVFLADGTNVIVDAEDKQDALDIVYDKYGEEGTIDKKSISTKSPEEIKARGEEAYKQMMKDIDTEYEKEFVKENYGWITDNAIPNIAMSVLSPSSMESIQGGNIPSVADIGVDVALNAAGLYAAPERLATAPGRIATAVGRVAPKAGRMISPAALKAGRMIAPTANRYKNIAVGAVEQGAIAGAGEGVLSTKHDRDYSMTAPLIGTVAGGAIGGTATTSMAKKLLDAGYQPDEIASIMNKLGATKSGSLKSFGDVGDLKQIGTSKVSIPGLLDDVLLPPKMWDSYTAYKQVGDDVAISPIREAMDAVKRTPDISLKEKERTLKELQDLEDTFYKKLIASDESDLKFLDELLGGEKSKYASDLGDDVDYIKEMVKKPATSVPLAGFLKDVEETITNPKIRRALISNIADKSGETKALKGLLDRGKYEDILQKTPDIIESGTLLETGKNILRAAPHSVKAARTVMQAPITVAERVKDRQELPKEKTPEYTNQSGYNSQGDLLYAPRGYITWEDLWAEAPKSK